MINIDITSAMKQIGCKSPIFYINEKDSDWSSLESIQREWIMKSANFSRFRFTLVSQLQLLCSIIAITNSSPLIAEHSPLNSTAGRSSTFIRFDEGIYNEAEFMSYEYEC